MGGRKPFQAEGITRSKALSQERDQSIIETEKAVRLGHCGMGQVTGEGQC